MEITWQADLSLPASGLACGHGCGVCRDTDERPLVAFADGFAWYHGDAPAVVRHHPARMPADPAAAAALRAAFEDLLRARDFGRALPAGYAVAVNG